METPKNLLSAEQKKLLDSKKELQKQGGTGKVIAAFLLGAIVGAFGFWLSEGDSKKVVTETTEDTEIMATTSEEGGSDTAAITKEETAGSAATPKARKDPVEVSGTNALAANDQKAGTAAEVTMITLSVPGWVAIHEDKDGGLGNILGAARFEPGIHLGVVELLRSTVAGATYHAVLYQDSGDRGFNTAEDAPIKNGKGEIIMATFKAN